MRLSNNLLENGRDFVRNSQFTVKSARKNPKKIKIILSDCILKIELLCGGLKAEALLFRRRRDL